MQSKEIFHTILSSRGDMSHMAQVFLALGQYMVYKPTIHQEGDMNTLYNSYHPLVEGWYEKKSYHPLDGGVIWDISEDDIGGDMMLGGVYIAGLMFEIQSSGSKDMTHWHVG